MKNEKLHGFSYDKNIANFEAFFWDKNFSKNLIFLRSIPVIVVARWTTTQKTKINIFVNFTEYLKKI